MVHAGIAIAKLPMKMTVRQTEVDGGTSVMSEGKKI